MTTYGYCGACVLPLDKCRCLKPEPVTAHPYVPPQFLGTPAKASDRQVGGDHYKDMRIQPNEYIWANNLNWFAGNIVKYATRAGRKGGKAGAVLDVEKIKHYAELWLERLSTEGEK